MYDLLPVAAPARMALTHTGRVLIRSLAIVVGYLVLQAVIVGEYWDSVDWSALPDATLGESIVIRDLIETVFRVALAGAFVALPSRRQQRLLHAGVVVALAAGPLVFPMPGYSRGFWTLTSLSYGGSWDTYTFGIELAGLVALAFRSDVDASRQTQRKSLWDLCVIALILPAAYWIWVTAPSSSAKGLTVVALAASALIGWTWRGRWKVAAAAGVVIAALRGTTILGDLLEYGALTDTGPLVFGVCAIALAGLASAAFCVSLQQAASLKRRVLIALAGFGASATACTMAQLIL